MEKKILLHEKTKVLIIAAVISVLTCQTFGENSKNTKTSQKIQNQKQAAKKTTPVRIVNPKVSPSSFKPEMPFREAINILRNCTTPPLNIVVLWRDLSENADITQVTPIGMDGVSGVSLKTHLNLLLMSLSSGSLTPLGYIIDDNVIIIGTKDRLPKKMVTRLYDISDLTAPPSMGGMMPGMGMGIGMGMGMMPYGTNGIPGGIQQYGNTGYPYQGYQNQSYVNQQQTYYNNQQRPMNSGRG